MAYCEVTSQAHLWGLRSTYKYFFAFHGYQIPTIQFTMFGGFQLRIYICPETWSDHLEEEPYNLVTWYVSPAGHALEGYMSVILGVTPSYYSIWSVQARWHPGLLLRVTIIERLHSPLLSPLFIYIVFKKMLGSQMTRQAVCGIVRALRMMFITHRMIHSVVFSLVNNDYSF